MDTTGETIPIERQAPSVGELFTGFLTLGMIGFGGVMPLARDMVVERRRWLSSQEFTDLLGLCQFLPGGNIMNMSVAIGLKFHGVAGAFASLVGLVAAPTAIVIGLGVLYDRFHADPNVRHLFAGLAAAAAGLLISMAAKILWPMRKNPIAIAIAALCILAIAVLRLPLLPVMAALAPLSIVLTWRFASWRAR